MLSIDGSHGEGGGQVLRTSLSLAAVLGRELRLFNIRAGRSKPGLAAQHLTCVRAAAQVCGAEVEGAEIGSTELTFLPGRARSRARMPDLRCDKVRGGRYSWQIGTAGSTSLVLQTVLPPLLFADEPSVVEIRGGTNVPWSPPFEYLERVFLPAIRQMGAHASMTRSRPGFFPKGGGRIRAEIAPLQAPLQPVNLTERGELRSLCAISLVEAELPDHIAHRQIEGAREALGHVASDPTAETLNPEADCPGTMLMIAAEFERGMGGFSALGKRGRPAEKVGAEAGRQAAAFLRSSATADLHLADQLLPYAALAAGTTAYVTEEVTEHLTTNAWVVAQFLDIACELDEDTGLVAVAGRGLGPPEVEVRGPVGRPAPPDGKGTIILEGPVEVSKVTEDERTDDVEEQGSEEPEQEPAEQPSEPEPGAAERGEAEAEQEEAAEEPTEAGEEAEIPPVEMNVFDLLRVSAVSFAQEAWYGLGIRLRPGASEVETDLRCARVAIDTVELLIRQLADELEPEEKQAFDGELTNLRINYVRLSGSEQQ